MGYSVYHDRKVIDLKDGRYMLLVNTADSNLRSDSGKMVRGWGCICQDGIVAFTMEQLEKVIEETYKETEYFEFRRPGGRFLSSESAIRWFKKALKTPIVLEEAIAWDSSENQIRVAIWKGINYQESRYLRTTEELIKNVQEHEAIQVERDNLNHKERDELTHYYFGFFGEDFIESRDLTAQRNVVAKAKNNPYVLAVYENGHKVGYIERKTKTRYIFSLFTSGAQSFASKTVAQKYVERFHSLVRGYELKIEDIK